MMKENVPRISKLSVVELEALKLDLADPRIQQQRLAIKYRLAPASIFYYKKKFAPTVAVIYDLPPLPSKAKPKGYKQYLQIYYKSIGRPYKRPPIFTPLGRHLNWL